MTVATQPETKAGSGRRAAFPHHYEVALSAAGPAATIESGARPRLEGGAPETFGGREDWWSPEHLLLASLGLCLKTTFDAFAAKEKLPVRGYACRVAGTLEKTRAGLEFTALIVEVDLEVDAADAERAARVMESAKKGCIVSNSLKTPIDLRLAVREA